MGQIIVFSKSQCPHCIEAKGLLTGLDIPFTEIDIGADIKDSMLMSLVSQRHTVPQIFFNDEHIGGADDLKSLGRDNIQDRARQALDAAERPAFLSTAYTQEQLEAAIIPIKDVLEPHQPADPTALPEYNAVRIWYRAMFGFLCNLYDQMSLAPEPMALFIGALSSMMSLVAKQTGQHFGMSCLATANAANCSYCSAHGADLSMKYAGQAPENIQALFDFLQGQKALEDLPFEDRVKAIVNLSARMTTQDIRREDLEQARGAVGIDNLQELVHSVGSMGCIMGFLNRFNDLVGVEIEASIKETVDQSALAAQWDWGTHDTADHANRYDYRDQDQGLDGPPSPEQFSEQVRSVLVEVFDELAPMHEKYAAFDQRLLPAWVGTFPEAHAIRSVGALYQAAFNAGVLAPQTKHLAAYVLARATNHPVMAEDERRIARLVSEDAEQLERKLAEADAYAAGADLAVDTVLSSSEIASLKLARVSQSFPHEVRGELVLELARELTPVQIVELIVALSVAGMGQRWANVNQAYAEYAFG
ncbi:MAG: glutaredoxin domain-containing protein [Gammaproteobacteria bacterium]